MVKERVHISVEEDVYNLLKETGIEVSKECNKFLKVLLDVKDSDEIELLKKIHNNANEIQKRQEEQFMLKELLKQKREQKVIDKKEQETKKRLNILRKEYRETGHIENLENIAKELNMDPEAIICAVERR